MEQCKYITHYFLSFIRRSLGDVTIDGKTPAEVTAEINEGKVKIEEMDINWFEMIFLIRCIEFLN